MEFKINENNREAKNLVEVIKNANPNSMNWNFGMKRKINQK